MAGNLIGTDITGTVAIANGSDGVEIDTRASGNTIGGTTGAARNVISGNDNIGVSTDPGATGNVVEGSYIGTDVTGTLALGNGGGGVGVSGSDNTIGGTTPARATRFPATITPTAGTSESRSAASDNLVAGNTIGTDVTGTVAVANFQGVVITGSNNTIGGTTAGAGNVISANVFDGVWIEGNASSANVVVGDYIGTDVTGTVAIAKRQRRGDHGRIRQHDWRI